ncbi:hypothetical protein SNE40_019856 [Patella caerulea]|uniref:Uncharacterized protein n=1 Tax=Patella caerulea TaxID=87958 RepID=A0AAN8J4I4_PATCE
MEETRSKPEKATGTRWLQHKRAACNSLIKSFPVIVCHLESLASDCSVKKDDQAKMQGYLKKLKSFKFVVNLLFFSQLLEPLSKLSLSLQSSGIDLLYAMYAMSCLEHLYTPLTNFEVTSDIKSLFDMAVSDSAIEYKGCKGSADIEKFEEDRKIICESVEKFVRTRFRDLNDKQEFQILKLIDLSIWPRS